MSLVSLPVCCFLEQVATYPKRITGGFNYSVRPVITYKQSQNFLFDPADTYCIIFSPAQLAFEEFFNSMDDINILFKSELAVNKNPGHGVDPRNRLYIFEKK